MLRPYLPIARVPIAHCLPSPVNLDASEFNNYTYLSR
jgi:hypothetical protein